MKKIETGFSNIFRFENILPVEDLLKIRTYVERKCGPSPRDPKGHSIPWKNGDWILNLDIDDPEIKKIFSNHREIVKGLVEECLQETLYIQISTMVLWRPGNYIPWHRDNTASSDEGDTGEDAKGLVATAVTYINDDYLGGVTHIQQENRIYESIPSAGSLIIFPSDSTGLHQVTEVTKCNRISISTMFTKNPEEAEDNLSKDDDSISY